MLVFMCCVEYKEKNDAIGENMEKKEKKFEGG